MKRMMVGAMALLCAITTQAQANHTVEGLTLRRDSVLKILELQRALYAKDESKRDSLTPLILSNEREIIRIQVDYDNHLKVVAERDIREALSEYVQAQREAEEYMREQQRRLAEESQVVAQQQPVKSNRNLVLNSCFKNHLQPVDYQHLCEAQLNEAKVKELVDQYMSKYAEQIALQGEYMSVQIKEDADQIAVKFTEVQQQLDTLEKEIKRLWSSLYYNKVYAYDLFMERTGNTKMLDMSAAAVSRAEHEIDANTNRYQSDVLVDYFARKKALAEYEVEIASTLTLIPARDSMRVVLHDLKNRDYRLSKLTLPQRNFIVYENIEIRKTPIYNSKNPVPQTMVYDMGVVYRIRLGLFSNRPNIYIMRGATPLSYSTTLHKGFYAYFAGGFRTEEEANEAAELMKRAGLREPIVAVWVDGVYYPTVEELYASGNLYNVEISGVSSLSDAMERLIASSLKDHTISRVGTGFIVGSFVDKLQAETLAASLRKLDSNIEVEVTKKP